MISPHAVIDAATNEDFVRFYGPSEFTGRWIGKAMRKGKLVAAIGGAFEHEDGTWYGFLEIPAGERRWSIYRHTISLLNEVKAQGAKTIKATCDPDIPRAAEFMARLGFVPTDEEIDAGKVWTWIHSA